MLPPCWNRPPHHPLKKVREAAQRPKQVKSESHSVKAYADDVTLFSTSKEAHQTVLVELDDTCSEIGLQICPDKCVSYVFDGQKICSGTTFKLQQCSTKNITSAPSKFLGQTLGANSRSTRSLSSKKITDKYIQPSIRSTRDLSEGNKRLGFTSSIWFPPSFSTLQWITSLNQPSTKSKPEPLLSKALAQHP